MDYMTITDRIWPALRRVMGLHTLAYRATGGRIGQTLPGMPGQMLLLEHVGARSGTKRTTPLLYIPDGENLVIVASKGGYPNHPGWFHNLKANPDIAVQVGAEVRSVHARVATPDERSRLWPKAIETYGGYAGYQARSRGREIPLVILEPRR